MKFKIIPFTTGGNTYYISPFTGQLNRTNASHYENKFCEKLLNALTYNNEPFKLNQLDPTINPSELIKDSVNKIEKYHNNLVRIDNKRFLLSWIYSSIKVPCFENSIIAFDNISQIKVQLISYDEMCLQRSLLVAKTSRSFWRSGVLFIGASIPSGKMHAWIIEGNHQPDRKDRDWIQFRPLLAFYY